MVLPQHVRVEFLLSVQAHESLNKNQKVPKQDFIKIHLNSFHTIGRDMAYK